jgi:hypothetical protein
MGLPYENELQKMIAEENESFQREVCDMIPLSTHHVIFKGEKYTIAGAAFIRSIEPFNQELCDLLFQAEKTAVSGHPMGGIEISDIIWEARKNKRENEVLYYDPDFISRDDEDVVAA